MFLGWHRGHDARFHWFAHFFVGASAALVVMALVTRRRRRPVPYPLVWPLLGHLVAMLPHLLFSTEAHERWMHAFPGHASTHFVPGGNLTWYLVFLAALALYLVEVRAARRDHPTGNGSGLRVRRWGEGPRVLFLHGLGASSRYWDQLATVTSGFEGLAPDLLGFGRSPKPRRAPYDVASHLEALRPLLSPGIVVVGHSTGAILAAALAADPTVPLSSVLLVGLPAYPDAATARHEIGRLGPLARLTIRSNPLAWLLCTATCWFRPLALLAGPLIVRDLPPAIVADGFRHNWRSFSRTLHRVVVEHRVRPDLAAARGDVRLLHGSDDREAPIAYAREAAEAAALDGASVTLEEVGGDHHIAVRAPELVAGPLHALVDQAARRR